MGNVAFLGSDAYNCVKISQAGILYQGILQAMDALSHIVGKNADDAQYLRVFFPQCFDDIQDAAAGGN